MTVFNLVLDVRKPARSIHQLVVGQGDQGDTIALELLDNGAALTLEDGQYIEYAMVTPDKRWVRLTDNITQVSGNTWNVAIDSHMTDFAGVAAVCYFDVRDADGTYRASSERFRLRVLESATARANLAPYSDQVDRLIAEASTITDAWEQQVADQQDAFDTAQSERATAFTSAQDARDAAFNDAQDARATAFNASQSERSSAFDDAMDDWGADVTSAAARANTAADAVDAALMGEMTPAVLTYISANALTDAQIDAMWEAALPTSEIGGE